MFFFIGINEELAEIAVIVIYQIALVFCLDGSPLVTLKQHTSGQNIKPDEGEQKKKQLPLF